MSSAGALNFGEFRGEPDTGFETFLGSHSTRLPDQVLPFWFP